MIEYWKMYRNRAHTVEILSNSGFNFQMGKFNKIGKFPLSELLLFFIIVKSTDNFSDFMI